MLFTESQLNIVNPLSILDEAVYLTSSEAKVSPLQLPVTIVSESVALINYEYLNQLMEDYGCSLEEAKIAVQEANQITETNLVMAVQEYQAILHHELVSEDSVILPISENDEIYQLCENIICDSLDLDSDEEINNFIEANLLAPLDWFINKTDSLGYKVANKIYKKDMEQNDRDQSKALYSYYHNLNKMTSDIHKARMADSNNPIARFKYGGKDRREKYLSLSAKRARKIIPLVQEKENLARKYDKIKNRRDFLGDMAGAGIRHAAWVGMGYGVGEAIKSIAEYRNKPKSIIAKKIASLRHIYSKYMESAQKHPEKASIFKKVAAKILSVIDKLLGFLQAKADYR